MLNLVAEKRKALGRKNQSLREEGWVPAVVYGERMKALPIKVKAEEIAKAYHEVGSSGLISLVVGKEEGAKSYSCLVHEIQRDPLDNHFLHVDFYHPSMKKKVTAEVPLVFEGIAPAVKEKGGVLVKEQLLVEVKGLVTELPKEIRVDLSGLKEIHDKILFQDLSIGKGLEILVDPEEIVVSVTPPRAVEEELEEPLAEVEAEVIGEKKEEGEEGEEEEKEERKEGNEKKS